MVPVYCVTILSVWYSVQGVFLHCFLPASCFLQLPHEDRYQNQDENQDHADGGVDNDAGEVLCLTVAEISDILRNFGNDREGGIICFFELDI